MNWLTFLFALHQILQKVDRATFWRWQERQSVDCEELVHLILWSELRWELRRGDRGILFDFFHFLHYLMRSVEF